MFGTKAGKRPFTAPYIPKIDVTKFLWGDLEYWHLQLIGVLVWEIELGRIDIMTEVSDEFHISEVDFALFWDEKKMSS